MKKFTRREFVTSAAALTAAGLSLQNPLAEAAAKKARQAIAPTAPAAGEKVIVVVNLFGGNDGLNTVIPIEPARYAEYLQLRPYDGHVNGLGYDLSELLPLNGVAEYALRPNLEAFQTLFNSGNLAIINGVGVPLNTLGKYSHSAQQETFQSCDTADSNALPSGWMGRYCDAVTLGQIPPGIDLGGGRLMVTGLARQPVSISSINGFQLKITADAAEKAIRRSTYETIMDTPVPEGGVGEQNRLYRKEAMQQSATILQEIADYPTIPYNEAGSPYPNTTQGRILQDAAKLIYADIGAQAICVGAGGYDTHSDQDALVGSTGMGKHGYLLYRISTALKGLFDDLTTLGLIDRVLIVTISEFGRNPKQNTNFGTDHGIASSAFVIGSAANLNPGIYGTYPSLTDFDGQYGLITSVDFRSVYATVAANFLGADPEPIVDPNNQEPPFPLLGFC
jgi:uncharacterized protein (DUF1501 family)